MKQALTVFLLFSQLMSQDDSKIYWNSLATDVTVGVPLADDESLIGGRIQVKASFDGGTSFNDLGDKFIIEKRDTDDLKEVSIPENVFEASPGFKEGAEARFIAEVWDRAGNSMIGSVSDSVLIIDQTLPTAVSMELTSSNELNPEMAMPGDSITFQLNTSEPIDPPLFEINGETYDGAVGVEKSWMLVYPADEADDGPITFIISYSDLAQNPGSPVTEATGGKVITMDGTPPELTDISLFTSNSNDSLLAIKGDSVFLEFTSSEPIRDISPSLNYTEAVLQKEDSLRFTYYHVFTEQDTEGVIPLILDYKDMAGNLGETVDETSDDSEVTFDMTPPADFKVETVGSLQGDAVAAEPGAEGEEDEKSSSKKGDSKGEPGMIMIIVLSVVGLTVLAVWVSWFKLFSKAGQAGWKALVPFFNLFVFTKIVEKPVWWIAIYLIVPVGYILSALQVSKLFGKNIVFSLGLIFLPLVFFPLLAFGKAQVKTAEN